MVNAILPMRIRCVYNCMASGGACSMLPFCVIKRCQLSGADSTTQAAALCFTIIHPFYITFCKIILASIWHFTTFYAIMLSMGILLALPIAAAISMIYRRRIEEAVAPAAVLMIAILFLSGVFSTFTPGFYLILLLAAAGAVYTAFMTIRGTKPLFLTPGLAALVAYFLLFLAFNYERHYTFGVDFAHWGLAARDFFQLSDFSNAADARDLTPGVPPATTLWIWLSLKLRGAYTEAACFQVMSMLQISFILPLFTYIRGRKDYRQWLMLFFAFLAIPMIASEKYAYFTLSPVFLLGYAAAYAMRSFERYRKRGKVFDLISLLSAMFLLGLTGYGGHVIGGIAILLGLCATLWPLRDALKEENVGGVSEVLRRLIPVGAMALSFLVPLVAWRVYYVASGAINNRTVASMVRDYRVPFEGTTTPVRMLFLVMNGLSDKSLGGIVGHALSLSVANFLIVVLIGIGIYHYFARKKADTLPSLFPQCIAILSGVLLYFLVLYLIYQFYVPAARADELAYLDLAVIPAVVFLITAFFTLALDYLTTSKRTFRLICFIALSISLLSVNLGTILLHLFDKPKATTYAILDNAYELGCQFSPGDRVFFISRPMNSRFSTIRAHAESSETVVSSLYYTLTEEQQVFINLSAQDLKHWHDNTRMALSLNDVSNMLRENGYRYVYLDQAGEDFEQRYSPLFAEGTTDDDTGLFEMVSYENGTVQLLRISSKEVTE